MSVQTKKFKWIYIPLIILVFIYMFPIYALVNTSFKTEEEIKYGPVRLPSHPTLESYEAAFTRLKPSIKNSIVMTLFATILSSLVGSITGYIFSKFSFKGSNILFIVLIMGFYIAPQSILIPLVLFMGKLGLYNTIFSLVLTHTAYGVPITTMLFKNYYDNIPYEIVDSAVVDGCDVPGIYRYIFFPLSMPGFAVVAIFQFTNIWNEFLFGLTLTQGVHSQPITVAVSNLKGTTVAAWNQICAGAIIATLPVVLIYILLMKFIIKGLLMGSVKG
ncbi:MAG: carbohydrate ABC transporter permease [Spirochaetales bacterium]|nr:carbohydrate ABC transporter permease [Spirochaetales bacterium]